MKKNPKAEQIAKAKIFVETWLGKGDEKQDTSRFWIQLCNDVFGISDATSVMQFEKPVKLKHTNFIDAYIPATRVLIEQKSADIDIHKAYKQSDGAMLTPYQQAKRYANEMSFSQRPRWIVICNFQEFLIYDLEKPHSEPEQLFLKDFEKEFYRLEFLVDEKNENIRREEEISMQAGKLVGKLYDAFITQYINPDAESLRSLNILCVRLVFCFYAEDAGLFEKRTSFEDYIKSFTPQNVRKALIDLFRWLDTKPEYRDKYEITLKPFPYVNGGLFKEEQIEIPNFTQEIVDVMVNYCAPFNWNEISPTIFGAVFESTLNPETRRKGGMHYTSIENIHKVIDPLFMDDLWTEFNGIVDINSDSSQQRNRKLMDLQDKIANLKFLDPACGSGNFLTETYISLRRLENKIITILNEGKKVIGFDSEFIKVNINQFYGIEINDFAVNVAMTAMWIAECQMAEETEKIVGQGIDFLPLRNCANIVEGNALRMDWRTLEKHPSVDAIYAEKLNVYKVQDFNAKPYAVEDSAAPYNGVYKELNVVTKELKIKELPKQEKSCVVYDYIIGNPPFVGYGFQSEQQKTDTREIYIDESGKTYKTAGKNDYVANWYFKAAQLIQYNDTRCAFVSTNSITQGEQVANVWQPIFDRFHTHIDFAWRSFKWENETTDKGNMAAVHCVVVGFSTKSNNKPKKIFLSKEDFIIVDNINPYLMGGHTVWIKSRQKPLCDVPYMTTGNRPADGGHLIIEEDEYEDFIKKEPAAQQWIKKLTGSEEYINGKNRYCLWLVGAKPSQILSMKEVYKRVQLCREDRLNGAPDRQKLADTPALFRELKNPDKYLIIPRVSSQNRQYIPIGFLGNDTIPTDSATIIIDAGLYHFGVLTSHVHNAWLHAVCGRLKSDYRYSKDIVYNNFPWPTQNDKEKLKIEKTAQTILDARRKYADCTLAQMYGESFFLFPDLRNAHRDNDLAVMDAYGFDHNMTDDKIVAQLFEMLGNRK